MLIVEIVEAKRKAGESAILHLNIKGGCILWKSGPATTENTEILGYWSLDNDECDRLIETDLVD